MLKLTPIKVNVTLPFSTVVSEVTIDPATEAYAVFARKNVAVGQLIDELYWDGILPEPNFLTIQIGEGRHIRMLPSYLECINHSCDPNVFFDTTNQRVVCIRPIAKGEELSFFYPSAEWKMSQPFDCHCGSDKCIGKVRGAKYLSPLQQHYYRFTDYIQQKLPALIIPFQPNEAEKSEQENYSVLKQKSLHRVQA